MNELQQWHSLVKQLGQEQQFKIENYIKNKTILTSIYILIIDPMNPFNWDGEKENLKKFLNQFIESNKDPKNPISELRKLVDNISLKELYYKDVK